MTSRSNTTPREVNEMQHLTTTTQSIWYGLTSEVHNELGIQGLAEHDLKYCIASNILDESFDWDYECCKTKKELMQVVNMLSSQNL